MKNYIKWSDIDRGLPLPLKPAASSLAFQFRKNSFATNRKLLDPTPDFSAQKRARYSNDYSSSAFDGLAFGSQWLEEDVEELLLAPAAPSLKIEKH